MNTEARFRVENPKAFKKCIAALRAKRIRTNVFKDHIFEPASRHFNLNRESMKVRIWKKPKRGVEVKYHLVAWKRGVKKDLFSVNISMPSERAALKLMRCWGFKRLFTFSRKGDVFKIREGEFALDAIDGIGSWVEVEGSAAFIEKVRGKLSLSRAVAKTIPQIYSGNVRKR